MKTHALRLYGKNDLRLDTFDLPQIAEDEILATIVSNSICMSDHKAAAQGADHKRVPQDIDKNPIIIGHEFSGVITQVGKKYANRFKPGMRYGIQPALAYPGRELEAPGYSFRYTGGQSTQVIIAREVLEMDCLLPYEGEGFYKASLSEPVSCIIGAFNTQYHYKAGTYQLKNGIVEGGAMAVLAGAGPMGLGAIDWAIHGPHKPRLLVITDVDQVRLDRAASIFSINEAKKNGVDLRYVNVKTSNPVADLMAITGNKGFDDVFVYAPVAPLIEQASAIMAFNGCLNFFAGPTRSDFKATINFYDVHYSGHHIVGSSGGNTDDMRDALEYMSKGKINPAVMITHVGGIDSAAKAVIDLPNIPGGKKLIYTNFSMPLTAIDDFAEKGKTDPFFAQLAELCARHNGLWSLDAEEYLLKNAKPIAV